MMDNCKYLYVRSQYWYVKVEQDHTGRRVPSREPNHDFLKNPVIENILKEKINWAHGFVLFIRLYISH